MTPAVPDPTVEALSEAERKMLTDALASAPAGCWDHEQCCWASVEAMFPAVERILAARAAAPDALRVQVQGLAQELRVTTLEWIESGRGIPQYSAPWFEGRLRAMLEDRPKGPGEGS